MAGTVEFAWVRVGTEKMDRDFVMIRNFDSSDCGMGSPYFHFILYAIWMYQGRLGVH